MANQNTRDQQPGGVVPKVILGIVVAAAVAFALWSAFRTPASQQLKPVASTDALPTQTASVAQPSQEQNFDEKEVAAMPRISVEDAQKAVASGSAVLIDVRDADSYMTSHIKGAMHIPLAYIAGEVPYLPRDKTIITYCTWPAEESSARAALILKQNGFTQIGAMLGGFEAWREKGLPTQTGTVQ